MAGFHLLTYSLTTAAATTLGDLQAVSDPIFTQRNGHFTFTDPLKLLAAQASSAAPIEALIKSPTWNAQTLFNVDPLTAGVAQPNPPIVMFLNDYLPVIPQDEEVQVQMTDATATANTLTGGLWVATPDWSMNVPKGIGPLAVFPARFSFTATLAANVWSGLGPIVFEQALRAGWYAVVGAKIYATAALYFRVQFPRSTLYNGRALRPGDCTSSAIGAQAWYTNLYVTSPFGVWGKFHTFELPQVEMYATAAAASNTYNGRLMLVKLSESTDPGGNVP
jgi:hypothetical protein